MQDGFSRYCSSIWLSNFSIRDNGRPVHLFLEMHPTHSLSRTFQLFKGISARKLFWRFPSLKKKLWGGHLWSRGKFFRSVGEVTTEKVEFYIKGTQTGGIFTKTSQTSLENFNA